MLKNLSLLLSLLIALTFLSSCSKDDPVTPAPPSEFVKVKTGSSFTYDQYATDSTNAMIPGTQLTSVSTVLRTDGAIAGKTGVIVVEDVKSGVHDTTYYAYETNNNVSMFSASPATGEPMWLTLPVGTGITSVTTSADSATEQGITTVIRVTMTISLLGTESMTVKGAALSVKKLQLSYHQVMTINGIPLVDAKVEYMLYYASSLGFMAKMTSVPRRDPAGGWVDGSVQALVDYDLK